MAIRRGWECGLHGIKREGIPSQFKLRHYQGMAVSQVVFLARLPIWMTMTFHFKLRNRFSAGGCLVPGTHPIYNMQLPIFPI
jgi:hypothetical protein